MDYTFTLSQQDVQTIFTGLGELKLKDAAATFGKISMQQQEQVAKASPPINSETVGGHIPAVA